MSILVAKNEARIEVRRAVGSNEFFVAHVENGRVRFMNSISFTNTPTEEEIRNYILFCKEVLETIKRTNLLPACLREYSASTKVENDGN